MKLSDLLLEGGISGEMKRVEKLFVKSFNSFLGNRSREVKLDFIERVVHDILAKSDIKHLILRLQKNKNSKCPK